MKIEKITSKQLSKREITDVRNRMVSLYKKLKNKGYQKRYIIEHILPKIIVFGEAEIMPKFI